MRLHGDAGAAGIEPQEVGRQNDQRARFAQRVEPLEVLDAGRPADALIREAISKEARVIVVGNRRMRGIGRVLGSVANSVAHNAPCDVYIANTYDAD